MTDLVLQSYFIDTCQPVQVAPGTDTDPGPQVRMVRYSVVGSNPDDALRRFFEDEAGVVVEETDPTDLIVVGFTPAGAPPIQL